MTQSQIANLKSQIPDPLVFHLACCSGFADPQTRGILPDVLANGWKPTRDWALSIMGKMSCRRVILWMPGGIGERDGYSFFGWLHAQAETPRATEDFVEAWAPVVQSGIEVIYYSGCGVDLGAAADRASDAQLHRMADEALAPAIETGASIALDDSTFAPMGSAVHRLFMYLQGQGVRAYGEAWPSNKAAWAWGRPWIADDQVYRDRLAWQTAVPPDPRAADLQYRAGLTNECIRLITHALPNSGEDPGNPASYILARMQAIQRDGCSVAACLSELTDKGMTRKDLGPGFWK